MANKNVFKEICDEILGGPFSILGDRAQDRLILLLNKMATEAFERGKAEKKHKRVSSRWSPTTDGGIAYVEICDEITNGPFCILNEAARHRYLALVRRMAVDAFDRGIGSNGKKP